MVVFEGCRGQPTLSVSPLRALVSTGDGSRLSTLRMRRALSRLTGSNLAGGVKVLEEEPAYTAWIRRQ